MTSIDTSELKFITPPEYQGQAVEYSYAVRDFVSRPDCIIERRREAGKPDQFGLYIDPTWEDGDGSNLEFWSGAPELGACVREWSAA
jgi:hypothetical protein